MKNSFSPLPSSGEEQSTLTGFVQTAVMTGYFWSCSHKPSLLEVKPCAKESLETMDCQRVS